MGLKSGDEMNFDNLNAIAVTCWDGFATRSFDGSSLVLIGSPDLSYYHTVEVEFVEVAYWACPTLMMDARFRMGTAAELQQMGALVSLSPEEKVFAIEADAGVGPRVFFVVAEVVRISEGLVKHEHMDPQREPAGA
jgi:hypothetical protein